MTERQSQGAISKFLDFALQPLPKFRRDDAHLVVNLEGHRQGGTQPLFPILSPDEEGVVATGVDVHCTVALIPHQSASADDYIVFLQYPFDDLRKLALLKSKFLIFPVTNRIF